MKKIIFVYILGILTATCIYVVAEGLTASDVEYKNTTVGSALDTLYQRSTYTEYSGDTIVTPSTIAQTLETNNKLLKSNITIDAIPSTYKELSTATTVAANKLLNGETAYDNFGNLITGNLSTDCVYGTFTWAQNDLDNGVVIAPFKARSFAIAGENSNAKYLFYYDSGFSATYIYRSVISSNDNISTTVVAISSNNAFKLNDNNTTLKFSNTWLNKKIYYMICK